MISERTHINKYLPFAFLYFFLNSLFLPLGLLYTSILAPFLLIWLYANKYLRAFWIYLVISLAFACIHLTNGVDMKAYAISFLLFSATIIFAICFHLFLRKVDSLGSIYKELLLWNFLLTLVAIALFFVPGASDIFWYDNVITPGAESVKRLKMFTYEASYYSTLFVPIALYYYLKMLLFKLRSAWLIILMVTLPLILSFSMGVIFGISLAIGFVFLSDIKLFFLKRKTPKYIVVTGIFFLLLLILLLKIAPENIFFTRIANIFGGHDTSFKGRTTDSFYIAWLIAQKKSLLFGCGLGQIKILGPDVLSVFYQGHYTVANTTIPNSSAETLAIYGIFGFVIRLSLEIYFFFKTKVYTNYYRLSLFLFIFIYQFTGSFINNVAEYVIWVLAFTNVFTEFEKARFQTKRVTS